MTWLLKTGSAILSCPLHDGIALLLDRNIVDQLLQPSSVLSDERVDRDQFHVSVTIKRYISMKRRFVSEVGSSLSLCRL
jgi:hypothetical protein